MFDSFTDLLDDYLEAREALSQWQAGDPDWGSPEHDEANRRLQLARNALNLAIPLTR